MEPSVEVIKQLAPKGVLRAAVCTGNFLLVVGETATGDPVGVSPHIAAAIAEALDVPLQLIPFQTPNEISDAAGEDVWDIGNIGAEPQREAVMDFTAAYAEIETTYMVPAGSSIESIDEVDSPGNRISVADGSAYFLWLQNNIKCAELRPVPFDLVFDQFVNEKMEAFASLRPHLLTELEKLPGARVLENRFSSVQQAVGINKGNIEALVWLKQFVENAKATGLVAKLIRQYGVQGKLFVAS